MSPWRRIISTIFAWSGGPRRRAYSKIGDILREIEREWAAELGFAELKALLTRVWESPLAWWVAARPHLIQVVPPQIAALFLARHVLNEDG